MAKRPDPWFSDVTSDDLQRIWSGLRDVYPEARVHFYLVESTEGYEPKGKKRWEVWMRVHDHTVVRSAGEPWSKDLEFPHLFDLRFLSMEEFSTALEKILDGVKQAQARWATPEYQKAMLEFRKRAPFPTPPEWRPN